MGTPPAGDDHGGPLFLMRYRSRSRRSLAGKETHPAFDEASGIVLMSHRLTPNAVCLYIAFELPAILPEGRNEVPFT